MTDARLPSSARVVLTVVAKLPSEHDSKTRLSPALDGAQRRALAEAMFLDKIDQARSIEGAELAVAYAPSHARASFEALVTEPVVWIDQGEGSLGDRLARTSEALFAAGYSAVILIGADSPTLPVTRLRTAVRALSAPRAAVDASEFVVGPAEDGGYYLLGMRRFERALFTAIDWSTERVFSQTMTALRSHGARPYLLEPWFDVDLPADLLRLRVALERDASLAPRTAALIAQWALPTPEPRLQ
ncbi:MAG: TIGR04282 family arsenosugar biosynthesis glycosyltransferase [Myxococcales bacterium]|nr:TIGR04282 family arsenosugar biosynthesis glycosyltransferase [Myxococcales bacterium]